VSQSTSSGDVRAGFRLRTIHLFQLVPWIAIVVAARQPIRDNSFLWHVRAGTLQLDAGEVLRTDPFSFTYGGRPWRTQSWLADVAYGALERQFGHALSWVSWLDIALFGATLVLMAMLIHRATRSVAATAVSVFVLGWLAVPFVNPRPVAFSFLALVALMAALERRFRWAVPLIIWIWAALHGSFIVGIGLVVLDAVRRRDRSATRLVGLSILAASLTAHGLAIWEVLAQFGRSRDALGLITEWQPPNLMSIPTLPYAALIVVVLIGATRRSIATGDLWVVAPFLVFGLTSGRAVLVGAIVVLPFAAQALSDPVGPKPDNQTGGPPPALVGAVGVVILILPFLLAAGPASLDEERFPIDAAAVLAPVPTFHGDVEGGYLIFERWPEQLVFTDDRAELYGGEFFRAFVEARGAVPGWEALFMEWDIAQALLPVDAPLAGVLASSNEWSEEFRDSAFVVFVRSS